MTNQLSKADIALLADISGAGWLAPLKHEFPSMRRLQAHGLVEPYDAVVQHGVFRRTELGSAFLAALTGDSNV